MTAERARIILRLAKLAVDVRKSLSAEEIGECRKHMSTEEVEDVFEMRQLAGPASTFLEVLKLIATKQLQ